MIRFFKDNLKERINNKTLDFKINFEIQKNLIVKPLFDEADDLAKKIYEHYNKPIFIGLSGGYDSEFICKTFVKNNLPFTPIIGLYDGNIKEINYALNFCKKNNLNPVVIETNEKQLLQIYFDVVFKLFRGKGFRAPINIICCDYAKRKNGIWIDGGTILSSRNNTLIENHLYSYTDYASSYCHTLFENLPVIDFLNFTPEIFLSGLLSVKNSYVNWRVCKSKIFDCEYREKIKHTFTSNFQNKIYEEWSKYKMPETRCYFGSREQILEKFNIVNHEV